MSKGIKRKLEIVTAVAATSECRHKLGAGIFLSGGRCIALATNKRTTNPNAKYPSRETPNTTYYQCAHAELGSILAVKNPEALKGSTIVVSRINKSGNIGLSRPCNTCYQYIKNAGIKKIIYSINKDEYGIEKVGSYAAEYNKRMIE